MSSFKPQLLATISIASIALAATPTHAQESGTLGEPDSAAATSTAEIVVTGSRIARRDYSSATPIVTVSAANLENQGSVGIENVLTSMPQFTPGNTRFSGNGQATVNLRGLGVNRNLVLLDGRRLQPSTASVVVDLNAIPSALIQSVEVITGGASAVYGSDAVSGVVNFKLKRDFNGAEIDARYSISDEGDGDEREISLIAGGDFGNNRGNAVVALSYASRDRLLANTRPFYRRGYATGERSFGTTYLPGGLFVVDPINQPSQAARDALFAGYGTPISGRVPATQYGFNMDGTLFAQNGAVNYRGPLNDAYVITPAGNVAYNQLLNQLVSPMERFSGFFNADYEITDSIELFAQGMFTQYDTESRVTGASTNGPWTISVPADYAFIPDDLRVLLDSRPDPDAPFSFTKYWSALGPQITENRNSIFQLTTGLKGSIVDSWTWNVHGSYGKTDILAETDAVSSTRTQTLLNSRSILVNGALVNVPQFYSPNSGITLTPNPDYENAINDGGRSIPGIGGGALPCPDGLNIFGDREYADSCIDYLKRPSKATTRITQQILEANVQGELFELPAGMVSVALGAGYRKNTYMFRPDAGGEGITTGDAVAVFPANPTGGSTSVKEGYAEVLIPLLEQLPMVENLELGLAYRYSDYARSGGVSTYKADINWSVLPELRLRGGYERAIRAPNVAELFQGPAFNLAGGNLANGDPCDFDSPLTTGANAGNRAAIQALCLAQGLPPGLLPTFKNTTLAATAVVTGNPTLVPEVADTFTAGGVFSVGSGAGLLGRFTFSLDYYDIRVKEAIGSLPSAVVYSKCFNQDGSNPSYDPNNIFCAGIFRTPSNGLPFFVAAPFANLGALRTKGIDIQLDWGVDLDALGFGADSGGLDVNVVANYLDSFEIQARPGQPFQDFAGTIGNATTGTGTFPDWKVLSTVSYANGPAQVGMRWLFVDSMADQSAVSAPAAVRPGVGTYHRFDLFGRVDLTDTIQLRGGIENLFDREPLVVSGVLGQTEPGTYDPIGRRFYLAVRARF